MFSPSGRLPLFIGMRYSFSRQRNRFIGVVSMVSLLGMALGVASLITVLSVMNGFAGELRDRILSLVPHITVQAADADISNWQNLAGQVGEHSRVVGVAPYLESKVLVSSAQVVRGALLAAIDPDAELSVSQVGGSVFSGSFESLAEPGYNMVIGSLAARALGVELGDQLEITVPRMTLTPLGSFPRRKSFTVTGIFEIGAQLDGSQIYISLRSGQKLLGAAQSVQGLRLRTTDLLQAPTVAGELQAQLGPDYRVEDWGDSQGNLFSAVRMEKVMMTVLLMSVVAVAAFNIVSTLVMAVTDKRSDIAVLRTMGAGAGTILVIFVAQGLFLATLGVSAGAVLGVGLALNISEVTLFIENLVGIKLFNPDVYFISDLPSRLEWSDVGTVTGLALCLSLLATLYPAWSATRVAPAEVLRYE